MNLPNKTMTKRTFVVKSGDTWEWEETKETTQALAKYWRTVEENNTNDKK